MLGTHQRLNSISSKATAFSFLFQVVVAVDG